MKNQIKNDIKEKSATFLAVDRQIIGLNIETKLVSNMFAYYQKLDTDVESQSNIKSKLIVSKALALFENWVKRRTDSLQDKKIPEVIAEIQRDCFSLLLQVLIFAIRSDGKIELDEHDNLYSILKETAQGDKWYGVVDSMLTESLNVSKITDKIRFNEEKLDVYFIAAMILQGDNFMERNFLESLAASLNIIPSLKTQLEHRATTYLKNTNV